MSTQQPAQHADRDGSERRRSMEREHERGLAADVAEPGCYPDAIGSLVNAAKAEAKARRTIADLQAEVKQLRLAKGPALFEETLSAVLARAEKAEAALARVEALMVHLHTDLVYVGDLRAALADPEAAG